MNMNVVPLDLESGLKFSALQGCIGGVVTTGTHFLLGWQITPLTGALRGAVSGGIGVLAMHISYVITERMLLSLGVSEDEIHADQNKDFFKSIMVIVAGLITFAVTPYYLEFLSQFISQVAITYLIYNFSDAEFFPL